MSADINQTLKDFARFLGEQDKDLKATITTNIGTAKTEAIQAAGTAADSKIGTAKTEIQTAYEAAIAALKTELIGGASEELDTFKELAEELNKLKEGGSNTPEALLQKINEIKGIAEGAKTALESVTLQELKDSYNAALTAAA